MPRNQGGLGDIQYPLVADLSKQIARDYDVLCRAEPPLRGLFLIDKDGVVRHQVVNDLPLGRSVDEALRMVQALQYFEAARRSLPGQLEGRPAVPSSRPWLIARRSFRLNTQPNVVCGSRVGVPLGSADATCWHEPARNYWPSRSDTRPQL